MKLSVERKILSKQKMKFFLIFSILLLATLGASQHLSLLRQVSGSLMFAIKTIRCRRSGFDSQASQIRHRAVNGSPPLRRFLGAALPMR